MSDIQATLEERKAFAVSQGVDMSKVTTHRLELNALREDGIFIDLDIRGTSMFSRAATWLELGVMDDITQRKFTKGRKSLIPAEVEKRLISIETRMRQNLEKLSFPMTGFTCRWVSYKAYPKWRANMDRLIAEFEEVKAEIIENLERYADVARQDFENVARRAWKAIMAQGQYEVIVLDHAVVCETEDEFVDAVVDAAVAKIPSAAEIEAKLVADYTTPMMYGESDIMEDRLRAVELEAEADAVYTEMRAARQVAAIRENVERENLLHAQEMHRLEENERRSQIEAMRAAEIEHARKRVQELGSPFEDVILHLRARVAEDARAMLESIGKNGYVRGKIAEKGRGLLEFYKLMAAHDDRELQSLLERLTAEIGPEGSNPAERRTEEIVETLNQLNELVHVTAEELQDVSRASFVLV